MGTQLSHPLRSRFRATCKHVTIFALTRFVWLKIPSYQSPGPHLADGLPNALPTHNLHP